MGETEDEGCGRRKRGEGGMRCSVRGRGVVADLESLWVFVGTTDMCDRNGDGNMPM